MIIILIVSIGVSFIGGDEEPCQLKDYDGNLQPCDSTHFLWERTKTTEIYKNLQTGEYTRTIGQGTQFIDDKTKGYPNYVSFNETFFNLINSDDPLFDYELNQYYEPGWNVYFKEDPTSGQVVKYIVNTTEITFQPMALNYRNDYNQLQQIEMVNSVTGINDTNKFVYPNAYGDGINLTYDNSLGMLKENLVIRSLDDLTPPEQYIIDGGNPTLDLDFIISTDSKIIIDGVEWDKKKTATSTNEVLIQDINGNTLYKLPSPFAEDSEGNTIGLTYQFKKSGSLYVILKTNYTWLESATFPVYIDPTIDLEDNDTEIVANIWTRTEAQNEWYNDSIIYIKYNLSSLPDATIENASAYFYVGQIMGGWDNDLIYERILNQTWGEGDTYGKLNVMPVANSTGSSSKFSVVGWDFLNVTEMIKEDFYVGNTSFSLRLQDPDANDTSKHNRTRNSGFAQLGNYDLIGSDGDDYVFLYEKDEPTNPAFRPYLELTYTPYIDINSPTPSQIFTDDVMNYTFNLTTSVNMSDCFWTNDSGKTNYTMQKTGDGSNNASFYNSTTDFLMDGSHSVRFWCNETDNTWRKSEVVSFDVDSVNVTQCRDLTIQGRNYTLQNNISSSNADCITITNNNIGFDGNWNTISVEDTNAGDSGASEGIYTNSDYGNITNLKINLTGSEGTGILIDDSAEGNNISNIIINSTTSDGQNIRLEGDDNSLKNLALYSTDSEGIVVLPSISSDNNVIDNCFIYTTGGYEDGISLDDGTNNLFSNCTINTTHSTSNGISMSGGLDADDYATFIDIIIDSVGNPISMATSSGSHEFINVTYLKNSVESVSSGGNITRKWYVQTEINDSDGNLQNANVTMYNVSTNELFSELTNANGQITRREVIEYINDGGTKTYHTPHTINVSKATFDTNSTEVNLTIENNYVHYVTLIPSLVIEIDHPKPQTYASNESLSLNYTITNVTTLDTCWFNILNSTNDMMNVTGGSELEIANTTINCLQNTTFNLSRDDTYTLNIWVNDTGNTVGTDNVIFGVSTVKPAVVLDVPTDDKFLNQTSQDIYFNFTATDSDGLDTCELWGNWTGTWHKNYTWTLPESAVQNYTTINLTNEIKTSWNVWCNDTLNNKGWALNNFTLTLDKTKPNIVIDYITTTTGSQTISFNVTITEPNLDSCWFSIYNSTSGIDGLNENVSFTCGTEKSATVSAFATYNLTIYANDSANNENSTTQAFTTTATTTSGGGGGGGENTVQVISVIQPTNYTKLISSLDRAKIYARLREACLNYSSLNNCRLTEDQKNDIIDILFEQNVKLSLGEFEEFFEQFLNDQLEEVSISSRDADLFGLYKSLLEILKAPLLLSPPRLDTFFLVLSEDSEFSYLVKSNKVLSGATLVSGELGLSVEQETDTTARVYYKIQNLDFSSKIVKGTISYVSDGESAFQEVNIRTIYLLSKPFLIGVGVVVGIISLMIFQRKRISKGLKKFNLKKLLKIR